VSEARAVVLGGGAVGLAFAAAAAAEGMPVRVLEGGPSRPAADPDLYDARVFALSPGTRAFLDATYGAAVARQIDTACLLIQVGNRVGNTSDFLLCWLSRGRFGLLPEER